VKWDGEAKGRCANIPRAEPGQEGDMTQPGREVRKWVEVEKREAEEWASFCCPRGWHGDRGRG